MGRPPIKGAIFFIALPLLSACDQFDTSYTLYRDSMALDNAQIDVASFDAADGAEYNAENCRIAQDLFASQPGVKVRYWCEKGRFKR